MWQQLVRQTCSLSYLVKWLLWVTSITTEALPNQATIREAARAEHVQRRASNPGRNANCMCLSCMPGKSSKTRHQAFLVLECFKPSHILGLPADLKDCQSMSLLGPETSNHSPAHSSALLLNEVHVQIICQANPKRPMVYDPWPCIQT